MKQTYQIENSDRRALIVSPYLDHVGGGERYMLSVASTLEKLGFSVYYAWDNGEDIAELANMLGIKIKEPKLDADIKKLYFARNPLSMYYATRSYDVVVYLSDGSLPVLGGRKNILHMQVPFHNVRGKDWKNQIKKHFIHAVIVNSHFTKKVIDQEYGIASRVVYPPVAMAPLKATKQKIILSVGRFEHSLNTKKQDILINAFKKASPKLAGWRLVLAGGSTDQAWVKKLESLAEGYPIEFAVNASYEKIRRLYAEAAIYWHAAGYGIDENNSPELVEHFGITTVEAIANKCVPVVVPYGGQKEIVTNSALHWESEKELIDKTCAIVESKNRNEYLTGMSVSDYSESIFQTHIKGLV